MNVMHLAGSGLFVLDLDRRTYAALSRDERYWHLIQPATPEIARAFDYVDADGRTQQPIQAGDLVCTCPGGRFKRHCYRLDEVVAFERNLAEDIAWGLAPSPLVAGGLTENVRSSEQPNPKPANTREAVPA